MSDLLFMSAHSRRLRGGLGWDINNLSRSCVGNLLGGFLLNCRRVGLQRLDLIDRLRIFFLQSIHLALQGFHLSSLLPVNHHAVRSKHCMQQHSYNENNCCYRSPSTPLDCKPRPRRTRPFNPPRRRSRGLRALIFRTTFGLIHRLTDSSPDTLADGLANASADGPIPRAIPHGAHPILSSWEDANSRRCS